MRYHPETDLFEALGCEAGAPAAELEAALARRRELLDAYEALLDDRERRAEYERRRAAYAARTTAVARRPRPSAWAELAPCLAVAAFSFFFTRG